MDDDVPGITRIHSTGSINKASGRDTDLFQLTCISPAPRFPSLWTFPFTLPWHAGQIGHEFPQVFLSYSVMIAASRESQDGSTSLITAPCREEEEGS